MKYVYLFLLLNCFNYYNSQELKFKKISNDVSIKSATDFEVSEELKQTVYKSSIGNETFMLLVQDLTGTDLPVKDEKDLEEFYIGAKEGITESPDLTLIDSESITINGLKALKVNCNMSVADDILRWESYTILLKEITYTMVFLYQPNPDANFLSQKNEIIQSFKLRESVSAKDQLKQTKEGKNTAYKIGEMVGEYSVYLLILGGILYFIFRKKKVS